MRRFGEFQSWESVAADEVPPSPAFVGNPKQRRQYLEAYAKVQYEQEAAERKARGETTEDTVADVHSRVQQLMMEANEKLPDYAPSPAKSLHEKSLREKLNESWQGKGYYARLMAQMASPSPARPNMRPPHMQRLHQGANGAAAAASCQLLLFPLNTLKTRAQARAFGARMTRDDLRMLYRGLVPDLFGTVPGRRCSWRRTRRRSETWADAGARGGGGRVGGVRRVGAHGGYIEAHAGGKGVVGDGGAVEREEEGSIPRVWEFFNARAFV